MPLEYVAPQASYSRVTCPARAFYSGVICPPSQLKFVVYFKGTMSQSTHAQWKTDITWHGVIFLFYRSKASLSLLLRLSIKSDNIQYARGCESVGVCGEYTENRWGTHCNDWVRAWVRERATYMSSCFAGNWESSGLFTSRAPQRSRQVIGIDKYWAVSLSVKSVFGRQPVLPLVSNVVPVLVYDILSWEKIKLVALLMRCGR